MRTTLDLDPEILSAAKQLASARSISIGKAVSELARRGLQSRESKASRSGFPVFDVPKDARPLTVEQVKRDEDEE